MLCTHIRIQTADGIASAREFRPNGSGPWPAVIFLMDAFGFRPAMDAMGERLASHGYYVLIPNVLYRAGEYSPFDMKTVWGDEKERTRLRAMLDALTPEIAMRDMKSYIDAALGAKGVGGKQVGMTGYCMGGMLGVRAAEAYPDRVAAVGAFHAGNLVTDKPDSPHLGVSRIRARLYIGGADNDRGFTPEHAQTLEAALTKANVRHTVEIVTGAAHGYAVSDSPAFNKDASENHWTKLLELLKETLHAA